MNLSQGIDYYMLYKRSFGSVCRSTEQILKAFLRSVGDRVLGRITTEQVQYFLDASEAGTTVWRIKHSVLRRFFEYWSWRGEMPALMMPNMRSAVRQTFIPYIYTKPQIRSLLAATKASQKRGQCKADAPTLRMFMLMLYATGARYSEVLNIRREDIAFKHSRLTLRGTGHKPPRCIPIGPDLKRELQGYLTSRSRPRRKGIVWLSKAGELVYKQNFSRSFERVRKIASVMREQNATYAPRLQDLRFTFAVHRITSWIRSGANLNRLLPALSTYMGNASFEAANDYLNLTPERFKKELQKLSPKRGRKRWRDDPELMRFLSSL